MTTIKDVTESLLTLKNKNNLPSDWLALINKWLNNDIIKKELAISHDEWVRDMLNNDMEPSTLEEHLIYFLEIDNSY